MAASACTSTCSLTEPTLRAASMVGLESTCITIPDCTYLLKPSLVTSSRYGPMGRFGNTKAPSAPLVTVRTPPVAVWVTLTVAPGTANPLESRTVPLIRDVEPCAHTAAQAKRQITIFAMVFILFLPASVLSCGNCISSPLTCQGVASGWLPGDHVAAFGR